MAVLEQLNKNQDENISEKELREAVQKGGFLDNEHHDYKDHIKSVGDALNNTELDEYDKILVESLRKTLNDEKEKIKASNEITQEDKRLLKVWVDLFRDNDDVKNEIKELEELINGPSIETKIVGDDTIEIDDKNENNSDITENKEKNPNDENILAKYNELSEPNKKNLFDNLKIGGDFTNDVDKFLENGYLELNIIKELGKETNKEKIKNEILSINLLSNIISDDTEKHEKLKSIINEQALKMSHSVNEKIANGGNTNFYSKEQIMLIQLWANVFYGEKININGKRGIYNYAKLNSKDKNENATNAYIYKLEIITRKDIKELNSGGYKDLLEIPNLQDILDQVQPKEVQDKIWKEFLDIYLPIRRDGIHFENQIGENKLFELLQDMILMELYKETPVDEEINNRTLIKEISESGSKLYEESDKIISELQKYKTLGEYYRNQVDEEKRNILNKNDENVDKNNVGLLNKELKKLGEKLNSLPKLKENASEGEIQQYKKIYKNSYKEIADDYISLWRNPKYKPYLEKNEALKTQIFSEIFVLRGKDGIDKVFGTDIKNEVDKIVDYLKSISPEMNKQIEETCDWYYMTLDAERNIEKGKSERGEKHFNKENIYTEYHQAIDNACININQQSPGYTTTYTSEVHIDGYYGNGYREVHTTTLNTKISTPFNEEEIIYKTNLDNENETIIPPNPDGWYAILPQELKDKSNNKQIKLAIINGKPCVYEFMDNGDIKYRIYDKEKNELVFDKTITQEELLKAETIESSRIKIRDAEHGEEFKKIQVDMKNFIEKNNAVNDFFKQFENQDLDGNELELLQKGSVQLYNMIVDFAKPETRSKLQKMKKDLLELGNQNSNKYENPHEKEIKAIIGNIDTILGFATEEQVKRAEEFMKLCTNTGKVHENDDRYDKTRQEWLTIGVSFIVAIGMTIVAIGSRGLGTPLAAGGRTAFFAALGIGAISTGSAMIASELTQCGLNARSGGGTIIVDGVEYHLDYNNPTLLQQALDPNSPVTWRDCVKGYGYQFVTGTLLQAGLMRFGAEASNFISKLVLKAPAGSFARKSADLVCKILCKERISSDAYTEGLINNLGKQACKEGFMKQFTREFLEETWEEGVEQAAQNSGTILGYIAVAIHCLKPHPGAAINIAGVSANPDIEISKKGKKLLVNSTYDCTNPDNFTILKNYYDGIPGYEVTVEDGNVLKVTAHGVSDGGKVIIDGKKDIEMTFRPSKAPVYIRSLPTELLEYGGININDNTGEITYNSKYNLAMLSAYYKQNKLGIIKINGDGSAKLITKNGTINLYEKNTESIRKPITQQEKSEISKRMEQNQGKISDAEKTLDFWAKGELGEYADMKMDITKTKEKIDKAKKALEDWINGTGKQYNSIEEFLEEHQLGLNEGKTTIKKEIIKEGEEGLTRLERYQLGLDDPKIETETKKRKKMQEKSKMLLTRLYYESIFVPLGLKTFVDPNLTMGENVDNQTFLDIKHYSENFEEFTKNDEFGLDENQNKTASKAEEIGNKILEQIAVNEGRNTSKPSEGKIEDTVMKEIESITDVNEKKIAKELWASIQAHSQGKISIEDQAYLFGMTMKHMADLMTAYPDLNPKQVFDLLNSNQNKLLHQHLRDLNTITSSDHGIKHVLRGNATLAENVFSQLDEKGTREKLYNQVDEDGKPTIKRENESLEQFKARMKVLTRQAIIDHDLGYTNKVNQAFDIEGFGKGFRMVSDHPLRSTIRVENHQSFYTEIFGEDGYNAIRESLPGHGSAQTQNISKILDGTATETDFVRGILSNVDCAGSPADFKIAHMFAQSGMISGLFNAYKLLNNGDIVGAKQQLTNLIETINDMQVSGELSGIKESRTKGIEAFLANKNFENMEPDKLKDVFGFHFNKFLGAFGIMTSINPETGMANIGINENGGWGAEFNLAGKSFELIADSFGAGTALKSFIGVCDDYGINDKGPTSKFLESQFKKAIKDWKNRKLKEQPLIDFIKQRLNPDSSTYKSDLDEFVAEFNRKGSKELKDGWEEVRVGKDLKFEKNIHKKDGSRERVTEPWIGFSTEGITIHGGNNVEITLNFEGNSYEGFDAIVNNINIIDSEIQENIDKLKENKINPEGIEAILPDIQNNLTALLELLNDTPGLDITDFETILNRINLLNEGERSTTNDGICRLTTYKNGTVDEIMNLDDFINEINKLKSTCKYMITKVHGSNPSINN